ncbi:SAM-dependent methyltransferase [Kibdelosporangium aridum]|uniref:SAM-dependent methyltransferase n=1 Tax=Kibdelosporangium aridum TaxID=2030 RepID=A0A428Z573_KIBAR|nr:class I SAM-dependent methyltransferase [Kibdelosporangium aridum]RSM81928.1 SAM-dependent methyltransferase [Kibdelosporangium aridum]
MTIDVRKQPGGRGSSWLAAVRDYTMMAALLVLPERWRARAFFEMRTARSRLTEDSAYRNLGYWKDDPDSLDKACEAMADLLGEAADLRAQGRVLDVGCGYAEQDVRWLELFQPRQIVGIDLVPSQVRQGRRRIAELGLADRIDLRVGSATELPFGDDWFDRVVALECALHFVTRADFFREARRVLRPGGRLALVDPVTSVDSGVSGYLERSLGAIPRGNVYSPDVYADKLREAGFVDVTMRSLRDDVYPGFAAYLARRLADAEVTDRMNAAVRAMWRQWVLSWQRTTSGRAAYVSKQDYILVVATAP